MIPLLKNEMDQIWGQFDRQKFILNDPIQVVHKMQRIPKYVQYGQLWFHGDNTFI